MENFEKYFRIGIYSIVSILVVTYILGRAFSCEYLLSFTKFDSNSGILWVVVIALVLAHISTLKSIIHEIALNKIQYLSEQEVVRLLENKLGSNKEFFRLIRDELSKLEKEDEEEKRKRGVSVRGNPTEKKFSSAGAILDK